MALSLLDYNPLVSESLLLPYKNCHVYFKIPFRCLPGSATAGWLPNCKLSGLPLRFVQTGRWEREITNAGIISDFDEAK